jgi:hypothetical protein
MVDYLNGGKKKLSGLKCVKISYIIRRPNIVSFDTKRMRSATWLLI